MSRSQFHTYTVLYLHMHGLVLEISISHWQDQPGSRRAFFNTQSCFLLIYYSHRHDPCGAQGTQQAPRASASNRKPAPAPQPLTRRPRRTTASNGATHIPSGKGAGLISSHERFHFPPLPSTATHRRYRESVGEQREKGREKWRG
jgi:hypothetical protein